MCCYPHGRLERRADRDPLQFRKGGVKGAEQLRSEPIETPSLDMFHSPLHMIMEKWLQVPLLEKGVWESLAFTLQVTFLPGSRCHRCLKENPASSAVPLR